MEDLMLEAYDECLVRAANRAYCDANCPEFDIMQWDITASVREVSLSICTQDLMITEGNGFPRCCLLPVENVAC